MSDGPHKSLNMRRGWKRLAERAWTDPFNDSERSRALATALENDWAIEVPKDLVARLRDVLDDHQGDLFGEPVIKRLEALRGDASGCPLAATLLDCAAQASHQGCRGEKALETAVREALRDRAESGRRQVQEHCLRAGSERGAERVGNRIEGAIAALDMKNIAKRCIGCDDAVEPRTPLKKTGIDDGVSLS